MPAIGTQQSELARLRAENAQLKDELKRCGLRIAELEAERQSVALALADYERIKKIVDNAIGMRGIDLKEKSDADRAI